MEEDGEAFTATRSETVRVFSLPTVMWPTGAWSAAALCRALERGREGGGMGGVGGGVRSVQTPVFKRGG